MQIIAASKTFYSHYLLTLTLDGQSKAGINRLTIYQHSACAALPVVAHLLSTSQTELSAQYTQERVPGLNVQVIVTAVDPQLNGYFPGTLYHFVSRTASFYIVHLSTPRVAANAIT